MSKYTAFRCPEDLLVKAKAKANKDHRSLSNYLITLIAKDVGGSAPAGKKTAPKKAVARSKR
jgi:hypothetical protein